MIFSSSTSFCNSVRRWRQQSNSSATGSVSTYGFCGSGSGAAGGARSIKSVLSSSTVFVNVHLPSRTMESRSHLSRSLRESEANFWRCRLLCSKPKVVDSMSILPSDLVSETVWRVIRSWKEHLRRSNWRNLSGNLTSPSAPLTSTDLTNLAHRQKASKTFHVNSPWRARSKICWAWMKKDS